MLQIDVVVINTAPMPPPYRPKLWLADVVAVMKFGSVVVDFAAERDGNCDLTVSGQKIVSPNRDLPSRMASALYPRT